MVVDVMLNSGGGELVLGAATILHDWIYIISVRDTTCIARSNIGMYFFEVIVIASGQ
jgi:hypothetical protein